MASVPSDADDGAFAYADPLPYLEIINEQLQESGKEPLFAEHRTEEGYDLTRSFDFRDWPIIESQGTVEFPDGMYDVPASRIRVLGKRGGKLVHACYEKIYLPLTGSHGEVMAKAYLPRPFQWSVTYRYHSWDYCECANAKLKLVAGPGYSELYHENCGRWRKSKVDGPLDEHIDSLNLAPPDEMYNGFYPTLPGSDPAHLNSGASGMDEYRGGKTLRARDGGEIRSGKEIRGGRAEHRRATKGMIAWDSGTQAHFDRIAAQNAVKQKAKNRAAVEKIVAQAPPSLGWD